MHPNRRIAFLLPFFLVLTLAFAAQAKPGPEGPKGEGRHDVDIAVIPLERNGVKLHLDRFVARGTLPERQILLVHGLTYSSHEFDVDFKDYSLVRFFARMGYAVWRVDVAGYGQSDKVKDGFMPNSDYAAEDIAAAAQKILEVSGQKQLDVLGWSWGTVTSSRFAASHPEMVRKLVLYAPILTGLGAGEVKTPFNHNTWAHAAGDFQTLPGGDIDYAIVEPAVVAFFQSNSWRYDGDSSPNGGRRDLLVSPEMRLIPLEKLTMPTLIIGGDKDPYLNLPAIKAAKLPEGSATILFPGAAHAMMMEKPYYRAFRKEVIDFLLGKDLDKPRRPEAMPRPVKPEHVKQEAL